MLQVTFAVGLGLIIYAGKAGGGDWQEFFQYARESKFVSSGLFNHCESMNKKYDII
jgi:hypothetical protein